MPLLCHLQETRLVFLIHTEPCFVRLLRTQLGQSFEMYMSTKRVHIHQIVGVWGFQKKLRADLLRVDSEGVNDTIA